MKRISKICNPENIVDYILTDKKYKGLNVYEKEKLIIKIFHSINWVKLKKENRIVVLQELEKIEAIKNNRAFYQFEVLDNDYKWETRLMDIGSSYKEQKLFVRKNFIEEGIKQAIKNNCVEKTKCDFFNAYLLNGLFHAQYHIMTDVYIKKLQSIVYKEHMEHLIWVLGGDLKDKKFKKDQPYYKYRMVPDRYYASLYARIKMREVFSSFYQDYGLDESYSKYLHYGAELEKFVIDSYRADYNNSNVYSEEELYSIFLEEYIRKISIRESISQEDIKREIALKPSIFDKK